MPPKSNDERLIKIAEALLARTEAGKIEWEARDYPGADDQFDYSTTWNTITVKSVDGDGQRPYGMYIKNENGLEVDHLINMDLGVQNLLSDLYSAARYIALDVDNNLDKLLDELSSEDPE
ncbi:hypothetical protein [Amycolatopsis sp. NPDC004169]|uniref:hypothetical protein n=1 Tax=Amycolatopsis sp. NPDC004169 TaxID=3154453 RepID=UPI0033B4A3ED